MGCIEAKSGSAYVKHTISNIFDLKKSTSKISNIIIDRLAMLFCEYYVILIIL